MARDKEQIVRESNEPNADLAAIAKKYKISLSTLYGYRSELNKNGSKPKPKPQVHVVRNKLVVLKEKRKRLLSEIDDVEQEILEHVLKS